MKPDHINIGQYRVTFTLHGPFVEIWIAESARCAGHWRLVGGRKRDELLAKAKAS